ncbi:MAG: histidine kinase [Bacteroidota bacterium]
MIKPSSILVFVCFALFSWSAINAQQGDIFVLKGQVRAKENGTPISGAEVSTDQGEYAITNGLGEFRINVRIGDVLLFQSPDFERVRYRIRSKEDVIVEVQDYAPSRQQKRVSALTAEHQVYLDSAEYYKSRDIAKSIEFVSQSISILGANGAKTQLARSLTLLGQVYLYHQQYDLAITNLQDAQKAKKTIKAGLLLAKAYLANANYTEAEKELAELLNLKRLEPLQRIALQEGLGDAYRGLGTTELALDYYKEGLKVAQKNQVSEKVIDINSKIAETYASLDRRIEAQGYYDNALQLSQRQAPQRAIQENEKVADFYNRSNRFQDEITLRKKSLDQIQQLPEKTVAKEKGIIGTDSITSQRINYKIAQAYIAQSRFDEAIPYLQRSIVEADDEDDLVVQKDATRELSEVYETKGDFTRAFANYQAYVTLVDSLYVRKEQEISRLARLNLDIAKKQNRISTLEQERELSQSKYSLALTEQELIGERSKRQEWLIYSLVFGMGLLGLTAFLFYRSNQKQKLANNLLALKSLRSQMNPHFIFNALNSVNSYIAKNDERSANRFLSDFSVLMRNVLENSEEDYIPFTKELELLRLYVKLEHSRFPDKFDYHIAVAKDVTVDAFEIPPMLLQPYVENAIWHGLRYKQEKGMLQITVEQIGKDILQITVADDGIGRKRSAALKTQHQKKQKSKGMGNIKKRIAILNTMHRNKVEVTISDLEESGTGTKVVLKLKRD